MDFANFLQQQKLQPKVDSPTLDFSDFLQTQKQVAKTVVQPATGNFSDFAKSNQPLKVSGINNTPPPKDPIPYNTQGSGVQDAMEGWVQRHIPFFEDLLKPAIIPMASAVITPIWDATQYYYSQTKVPGKILKASGNNTNSTPESLEPDSVRQDRAIRDNLLPVYTDVNGQARTVLNDLPIVNKTPAQVGGDIAQSVMTVYAPELGGELLAAGFSQKAAGETLARIFSQGATRGMINFGLPFGTAQAFSSGTKDPKEFASIVLQNMAMSGLMSGVSEALPLSVTRGLEVKDNVLKKINDIQNGVYYDLLSKGYSSEQARALASQGGYLGNPGGIPQAPETPTSPEEPQIKQRGFITSIKNSDFTAEQVSEEIQSNYTPITDSAAVKRASDLILRDPTAAKDLVMSDQQGKDPVVTGIMLFKEANARVQASQRTGNLDMQAVRDAVEYGQRIAEKLTPQAQAVQAASLLNKSLETPEGALWEATKFVDRINRTVAPKFNEVVGDVGRNFSDLNTKAVEQVIDELPELEGVGRQEPDLSQFSKFTQDLYNYQGEPAEKLAKKVGQDITPPKPKKVNLVDDMVNTLYKIAKEELPDKEKSLPRSPTEFIKEALQNKEDYKSAWDKAQTLLYSKYAGDTAAMKKLSQFFERDLQSDLPISEKQVTGSLREGMKEQNLNLADIVRQHYTQQSEIGKNLADSIIQKTGATEEDAAALANKVQKKFDELTSAKKESILKQMFKEVKQKPPKSYIQKIIEKSNLGAFDNVNFRSEVAKSLGIQTLSAEDAKMIMDRADFIQRLPEGKQKTYEVNALKKSIQDLRQPSNVRKWLIHPFKQFIFSFAATKKVGGELTQELVESGARGIASALDTAIGFFTGKREISFTGSNLVLMLKQAKESSASSLDYFKTGVASGLRASLDQKLGESGINDFSYDTKYFNSPFLNMWANISSRTLGTTTQLFGDMAVASHLYEEAKVTAKNEGLKGDDYKTRVRDLFKNPTDQMAKNAIEFSDFMTFQDKNMFSSMFLSLKSGLRKEGEVEGAVGEIAIPVAKTPGSILHKMLIDYGPASPLKLLWDQLDPATRGQKSFSLDFGRMAMGSILMGTGYYLAAKGLVSGSYPNTKAESDRWSAEGITPNSVLIGGKWINVGLEFAPAGDMLGLGADMFKLHQDNSGLALIGAVTTDTIKKVGESPMLYGLSSELQAISNPEQYGSTIVQRLAGAAIPTVVQRIAHTLDPIKRNPEGVVQQLESEIPGLSQKVPPAVDVLGNLRKNTSTLDPFSSSNYTPSRVLDEAARIGQSITTPNKTVSGIKMSNNEYAIFSEKKGQVLNLLLQQAMDNKNYGDLSDDDKKTLFQSLDRSAATLVDNYTFPRLMVERYNLPSTISAPAMKSALDALNKKYGAKFTKASVSKQKQVLQLYFQQSLTNK